jgi:hypothetical protein
MRKTRRVGLLIGWCRISLYFVFLFFGDPDRLTSEFIIVLRAAEKQKNLLAKEPKEQSQDQAHEDAGDDGEIDCEISPAVMNISRKSTQPISSQT